MQGIEWQRLTFWRTKRTAVDPLLRDKQELVEEIREALLEWQHARLRLDQAHGQDQIDYAIFAMETAEKRYEMLLRDAKRLHVHVLRIGMGPVIGG